MLHRSDHFHQISFASDAVWYKCWEGSGVVVAQKKMKQNKLLFKLALASVTRQNADAGEMMHRKRDALLKTFRERKTVMVNTSQVTADCVVLFCCAEPCFLVKVTRNAIDVYLEDAQCDAEEEPSETDALL